MPSASALVNQLLTPGVTLSAEQIAAVAAIENALRTTGVALLSGPAGSGKTSRVVPAVEHVGWMATTHRAAYVLNQTRESRNGGGARARTVHSQFFRYIGEPDDQLGRGAPPWAKAWFSNWARGSGELFIAVAPEAMFAAVNGASEMLLVFGETEIHWLPEAHAGVTRDEVRYPARPSRPSTDWKRLTVSQATAVKV